MTLEAPSGFSWLDVHTEHVTLLEELANTLLNEHSRDALSWIGQTEDPTYSPPSPAISFTPVPVQLAFTRVQCTVIDVSNAAFDVLNITLGQLKLPFWSVLRGPTTSWGGMVAR